MLRKTWGEIVRRDDEEKDAVERPMIEGATPSLDFAGWFGTAPPFVIASRMRSTRGSCA